MDELPVSAIPKIEEEIVKRVIEIEGISLDTLLLDATNFFAFINTTNNRCSLAQRGKISHMREKTLDLPDIRDIFEKKSRSYHKSSVKNVALNVNIL